MTATRKPYAAFWALLLLPLLAQAQTVSHHPDPTDALDTRWAWAQDQANSLDTYWVGYSIQRLMREHSFIGTFYSPRRSDHISLRALLTGIPDEEETLADDEAVRREVQRVLDDYDQDEQPETRVWKDVALLFRFEGGRPLPVKIKVSNLSQHVDLSEHPLFWLGSSDNRPSLSLLESVYARSTDRETQERLMMAIGMHQEPERVIPFLTDVLNGQAHHDVREKAAFWLGQTHDPAALAVLIRTVKEDRDEDVREQAVFGISQLDLPEATTTLIDLAYHAEEQSIRKKAIFWLGQHASRQAAHALKDIAYDDDETEIQKQAVFALSQLDDQQAVPLLIDLARSHGNPEVRKQAIFWLGNSDDPRTLDALVAFIREG